MTIKNNGQRRNPKYLLSSGFLLVLAIISMYLTFRDSFLVQRAFYRSRQFGKDEHIFIPVGTEDPMPLQAVCPGK